MIWYKQLQPLISGGLPAGRSSLELEVVIPVIEKDFATLPYAIDGVRKNLLHPIRKISVIAPDSQAIRDVCEQLHVAFVSETTVAPVARSDIRYAVAGKDRSGWLYQQLIKLNADTIVECGSFLVLDADTIMTSPQKLEAAGKVILLASEEYHPPYYETYERMFGRKPPSLLSFVCHYMLFEMVALRALKQAIENRSGKDWAQAILDSVDKTEASGFSEYETYGNFFSEHFSGKMIRRYANNRRLPPGAIPEVPPSLRESNTPFASISLHVYDVSS